MEPIEEYEKDKTLVIKYNNNYSELSQKVKNTMKGQLHLD
jgi:hypothetical protein